MIAAVRVRGRTGIKKDIQDTLMMLRLDRINHAVLIQENPSYLGMLRKAKDHITWGQIDPDTLTQLIRKRGRLKGNLKVTDDYIKERTDYSTIEDLSRAVLESELNLEDVSIKPIFRLHPPRKGYEDTKKTYKENGSLGYRGEEIGDLIRRMI